MSLGADSLLPPVEADHTDVRAFVERWRVSEASELQNTQMFLTELCELLAVAPPDPATGDPARDLYCFERPVRLGGDERRTVGRIDLYKAGAFVLEAKQGSDKGRRLGTAKRGSPGWAIAMHEAYGQALSYASQLEKPPPFLVVCDVGYAFDLYACFDGSTSYRAFPDPPSHRFFLADLLDKPLHLQRLRALFTQPHALDPSTRQAKVTREIAEDLADLARGLEVSGHDPELVARFLMQCIFAMFAEDVGLFPDRRRLFQEYLEKFWLPHPKGFAPGVEQFFRTMNTGGVLITGDRIHRFNGGLFREVTPLELTAEQLTVLHAAAKKDWSQVEPAIFGTLLERALHAKERHALGAHYTPRAYVERLVRPTIEEPLRREWLVVRAEASQLVATGDAKEVKKAIDALHRFHARLCKIRVLDPACGSGNFLYVALDLLKQLEAEVLEQMRQLGEDNERLDLHGVTVSPAQFLGIEKKRWAKEIAELVLWIGHLRWHYRLKGKAAPPPDPVLQDHGNIECRDAVLAWDGEPEIRLDAHGKPVDRWDGESTKTDPVTGKEIPDESKRVVVWDYANPRPATWPKADYIVGNPPFIGKQRVRAVLGQGYVEALRAAHSNTVPDGADFVMYWWAIAAEKVCANDAAAFGLITTNSISQALNRRVIEAAVTRGLCIGFAVPDHPWVDGEDGAAVRIAMTAGRRGDPSQGRLSILTSEQDGDGETPRLHFEVHVGPITAKLRVGVDPTRCSPLRANSGLASMGPMLGSRGFLLTREERQAIVAADGGDAERVVRPLRGGRDLLYQPRGLYAIDLHGRSISEVKARLPHIYQRLASLVQPERAQNSDRKLRDQWWLFRRSNEMQRSLIDGLRRFIVTTETAKHRIFSFCPLNTLAEHGTISLGFEDAFHLGVLSSDVHVAWALAAGGRLGVGNDPRYNKTLCFDPFPFPAPTDAQKERIRELAERLDAHRKRQLGAHEKLTITGMYNVLEKLRSGEALTDKERVTHEQGLVTLLRQIHDELDAAVLDAYGWPHDLTDEQILERLVALNKERVAEEERGLVRWLRPDFQAPATKAAKPVQQTLGADDEEEDDDAPVAATKTKLPAWPKTFFERASLVRDLVLGGERDDWTAEAVARAFARAKAKDAEIILDSFAALGQLVVVVDGGERRYCRALRSAA